MYPQTQPPQQVFGSPNASGPAGLDAAVSKLFPTATGGAPAPIDPTIPVDPYENLDTQKLLKRFQDTKRDAQSLRYVFERLWWRVMLYLLDRQWIFFDAKRNEWRDKRLKKWIPKPVTNKIREVQSAIRAMFAAVQLGIISRPNGGDPKNVTTANTVDGLQPLIHEEHDMDEVMRLSDFWMVNLGNAFLYPWWNPDAGKTIPIMHEQCMGVQHDEMGMPVVDPTTGQPVPCNYVEDPAQAPVPGQFSCPQCGSVQSKPVKVGDQNEGKGETDVCSPFEILLPSYATNPKEVDRLIRIRWRSRSYYEINYPDLASTLKFEKQTQDRSLNMFKALAAQSSLGTMPFSTSGGAGSGDQSEGITEYEYWERPTKEWPRGLFFRVIGESNEKILEDPEQSTPGPLPFTTLQDEPIWPWVHVSYEAFGGRLWGQGAIDPLLQKQDQLNQLDSQVQLSIQRMGNPIWLEPKGTEVEKFTGEPGLVVKYAMVGTQGAKPERIPGEPINASYFQLRQQYLQDIEELAGTYDVLKGAKPTGVEAFSALQLLVERSQSRFTSAFAARGEAYRQWFAVALELERKYGPKKRIVSMLGPNNTWTFQTFQQADLQGDVSIVVEDGTNVPKTALGKRAAMEQATNMGFVNAQDPDTQYAFMSEMGLTHLIPGLDTSKKAALRRQDQFEQWAQGGATRGTGTPAPLTVQPWDNPQILMSELTKWANSDRMQMLMSDPGVGQEVTMAVMAYFQQLSQILAQLAAQQAAAQAPKQEPGHGAGGAQGMSRSNANSNAHGTAQPTQHPGAAA